MNSAFIEAPNHEKEKKRVVRNRKKDTKSKDDKFLSLHKMNLQMFKEVEEQHQRFLQPLTESQRKVEKGKRKKEQEWEKEQDAFLKHAKFFTKERE